MHYGADGLWMQVKAKAKKAPHLSRPVSARNTNQYVRSLNDKLKNIQESY